MMSFSPRESRYISSERSMLVLSRRIGEVLRIGADVTVTVVAVKGAYIRIGIDAPAGVAVHREELYQRIRRGIAPPHINEPSSNPRGSVKHTPAAAPVLRSPLRQRFS
jgi:carbon storage regulator